jgi:putative ABC transport system ATP-binding protein
VITVSNLTKTYGSGPAAVTALDGATLDIRRGELLMLAGPSGSGKTTLVSIVGCILKATSGSVKIDGREIAGLPESKLPPIRLEYFGFIFQGFNLFPALTARENVEVALDLKKVRGTAARKRAAELLSMVGLGNKLDALPANLSGGQKQRVAIARALAGDPPVVLADEPTASLDSHAGHTVVEILSALAHERGRAVVVVTHDPRVLRYADRIVRMEDGRIVSKPADEGVAA